MIRQIRITAVCTAVVGIFYLLLGGQEAWSHSPGQAASARAASADPIVLDWRPPAGWIAEARRLALEFADSQGWTDPRCRGAVEFTAIANVEEVLGFPASGFASVGDRECRAWIDADVPSDPGLFCMVAVHEWLHEIRDDGWHSDAPGHPLNGRALDYEPCRRPWGSVAERGIGRNEARRAVRARVGRTLRLRLRPWAVAPATGRAVQWLARIGSGDGARFLRVRRARSGRIVVGRA